MKGLRVLRLFKYACFYLVVLHSTSRQKNQFHKRKVIAEKAVENQAVGDGS